MTTSGDRLKYACGETDYPLLPMGDGPLYVLPTALAAGLPPDALPPLRDALPYRYAGLPWWADPWGAPCLSMQQVAKVNRLEGESLVASLLPSPLPDWPLVTLWLRKLRVVRFETLIVTKAHAWMEALPGLSPPFAEAMMAMTEGVAARAFLVLATLLAPSAVPRPRTPPAPPSVASYTPTTASPPLVTVAQVARLLQTTALRTPHLAAALTPWLTNWQGLLADTTQRMLVRTAAGLETQLATERLLNDWHPDPAGARALIEQAVHNVVGTDQVRLPYKPADAPAEAFEESADRWRRQAALSLSTYPKGHQQSLATWSRRLDIPLWVLEQAVETGGLSLTGNDHAPMTNAQHLKDWALSTVGVGARPAVRGP